MSEILVGSISEAAETIGLSEFFIGAIVVAIVGNAAEHWVAVLVARKDKMDLAVNIAIGSSAQIALFVAPVLVLALVRDRARTRCRSSSTASSSAALVLAVADRQPGHAGRRVDVVRGPPAAGGLPRHRRRVLLRLTPSTYDTRSYIGVVPVNLPPLIAPPLAALGDDPGAIVVVIAIVVALLLVDLLLFARDREPTFRESVVVEHRLARARRARRDPDGALRRAATTASATSPST